ncbi:MAG: ATP-binding cassette domain-containing protein [Myxococcales bacterium]|nr:ATP-binding cassette domain-containing protein [Myxococcales bacterium]
MTDTPAGPKASPNEAGALLVAEGLSKEYRRSGWGGGGTTVRAVDGVDLQVAEGRTLALVGESGCGKSTLGRCLLRLEEPTSGRVTFGGREVTKMSRSELRAFRRDAQIVFQDPRGALNPKITVGESVVEGLLVHGIIKRREIEREARRLLERVGVEPAAHSRYPGEFSGGQRQRIGIARALALQPKLLLADEPTSALDVSIQAQIINLLLDLQDEYGLTYVFITHDLRLVRFFAHDVAVMYLGRIVEEAPCEQLFARPRHPYTQLLLASTPSVDPAERRLASVAALESDRREPSAGCPFAPRCPARVALCEREIPRLSRSGGRGGVACHVAQKEDETS